MDVSSFSRGMAQIDERSRPIKVKPGAKKPTIEDAADVTVFDILEDTRVKELVDDISNSSLSDRPFGNFRDETYTYRGDYDDEVILTRAERRRSVGLPEVPTDDEQEDDSDKENEPELIARPAKRSRLYQGVDDSGISFSLPADDHVEPVLCLQEDYDDMETNKENIPPFSSGLGHDFHESQFEFTPSMPLDVEQQKLLDPFALTTSQPPCPLSAIHDDDDPSVCPHAYSQEDLDQDTFLPLSFDSHYPNSACASQLQRTEERLPDLSVRRDSDAIQPDMPSPRVQDENADTGLFIPDADPENGPFTAGRMPETTPTVEVLPRKTLSEFVTLRGKTISRTKSPTVQLPVQADEVSVSRGVPNDILDRNTLCLPSSSTLPSCLHRYIASIDLIQKQELVRSLRLPQCAIDLVERNHLNGVDLIVDPHAAVVYASLLSLPAECEALCAKLGEQSWRFSRLLVIFEAYPCSHSYKAYSSETPVPYAFTQPVLKAIKKLRRDLEISEACETKCSTTIIQFAFATNTVESARFARFFGDAAEAQDETQGVVWGNREWLDGDEQEVRRNTFLVCTLLRSPG
jgi:hypothetical protein